MARKRRYRKRRNLLAEIDWSLNPDAAREIISVVLFVLGGLFLLSMLGLAGSLGALFKQLLLTLWGTVGYLVPAIMAGLAVVLWLPKKFPVKPVSILGLVLTLIFLPAFLALFRPILGGNIGEGISSIFIKSAGIFAAFFLLLGALVGSLLLTFNTSLAGLFLRLKLAWFKSRPKINLPKVPVFQTTGGLNVQATVELPQTTSADMAWSFPPLDLLEQSETKPNSGNIAKNVEIIQKTLKDFGIEVAMGDVSIGPTVTQYTLKPAEGVKLTAIVARANDLALALAAHPIRLEAPIPGKAAVGIEVPNKVAAIVTLREVLESDDFQGVKSPLAIALGRDVGGAPLAVDLAKMPHLLIAGSTGSGKTIALHSLITSFLYRNSPATLRLILVDPKRVEFTHHNGLPHLLAPVINDVAQTISALRWAISEMERRFHLLSQSHRRDIDEYNARPTDGRLPYIVIVIDELADLMAQAANEVEGAIVRLSQMARATGIHLVVATQRPSVDVITGLIKANITARMAFAVASNVDSRTILDTSGAEKLLGRGDMLFLSSDLAKPRRIQGSYISSAETKKVTDFIKTEGKAAYDESILDYQPATTASSEGATVDDEMFEEAKAVVIQAGRASASLLQRRLRIGYARAARLLDLMEEAGAVGPEQGAKPREVLVGPEALIKRENPTGPIE